MTNKVLHIKKFDGGRSTPDEFHRKNGMSRRKCATCSSSKLAIRIKVLVPHDELVRRNPDFVAMIITANPDGPFVPTIDTKYGKMVRVSDVSFCDHCRVGAEREAARGPSWALVEIEKEGLSSQYKTVVAVPRVIPSKA